MKRFSLKSILRKNDVWVSGGRIKQVPKWYVKFRQFFCWHKWYEYSLPWAHRIKNRFFECEKCLKTKSKPNYNYNKPGYPLPTDPDIRSLYRF